MKHGLVAMTLSILAGAAAAQEPLRVHAAGSLREAMTAIARAFEGGGGPKVELVFGASGLLRERLAAGERTDVFASADMGHPQALVASGRAVNARPFARNRLCALTQAAVTATPATLLAVLLDPATRLATSTPRADPSGDYAWAMFERAERARPGARAMLAQKARQLVGGPESAPTPAGRTAYGYWMAENAADVFLTYCTNAVLAQREVAGLKRVELPPELAVEAVYGVALMTGAAGAGARFRDFLLAPAGQAILAGEGFARAD